MAAGDVTRRLAVELQARTSRFVRGMRDAQSQTTRLSNSFKGLAQAAGATFGTYQVVRFARASVRAFNEQEDAVESLRAALMVAGKDGTASLKQLTESAAELQRQTRFADESLIKATATLSALAPSLSPDELERAQRAMIGLAAVFTKGDLDSAALAIGKSLGGTRDLLALWGLGIGTTGDAHERLNRLMEKTGNLFEIARQQAGTTRGALDQLSNAWGDLKEQVGAVIVNVLTFGDNSRTLTQAFYDWTKALEDNREEIVAWARAIIATAAFAVRGLYNSVAVLADIIIWTFLRIREKGTELRIWLKEFALDLKIPGSPGAERLEGQIDGLNNKLRKTRAQLREVLAMGAENLGDIEDAAVKAQEAFAELLAVQTPGGPLQAIYDLMTAVQAWQTAQRRAADDAVNGLTGVAAAYRNVSDAVPLLQFGGPLGAIGATGQSPAGGFFAAVPQELAGVMDEVDAANARISAKIQGNLRESSSTAAKFAQSAFQTVGNAIVNGIIYGIKDAGDVLKSIFAALLNNLLSIGISRLKIFSPSHVTREWGVALVEGFGVGFRAAQPGLDRAWGTTMGAFTAPGATAASPMSPQIVVDMSGVTLFGDPATLARHPGSQIFIREGVTNARNSGF